MGKSCRITMILFLSALLIGCSSSGGKQKTERMDFDKNIEWKAPDPAAGNKPKILFVGNSQTFYNNLTTTFVNIADAFGRKSRVYELSQGYYSLKLFADTQDQAGAMLNKALTQTTWDFVILQENTDAVLSSSPEEEMYPYARILDEKVKASGGQTVFFMTWAPKNGVKNGIINQKCEDLQSVLAKNYMTIADELDGLVIPAGVGFMRCTALYPEIELWDKDGRHPSPEGTYLAACIIYTIVFQESPENCSYAAGLDEDVALKLQGIAAETVLNIQ